MPSAGNNTLRSKVLTAASVIIVGAGLHLGQGLFLPLAVAVLLSLILSPLVDLGERLHLPRTVAVILVVVLVFGCIGMGGFLVAGQAASLAKSLPEYRTTASQKLESIRGPFAKLLTKLQGAVKNVEAAAAPKAPEEGKEGEKEAVKVEIAQAPPSPIQIAAAIGGMFLSAAGAFAVVLLLVVFFLIYKAEIRDRVIRLAGDAQVTLTTQTITDTTKGVSRYLFAQAIVNGSYGVVLGFGLYLLGVPGALLWGCLGALLRFVPYLGPTLAAGLPMLLSFGVFPGWSRPLGVAIFVIILEILVNNVVEPIAYGKRTGMSPLAVVLAAVFWAWMWGGIGLILAVPLTVCLVSLGKHVPSLRFLAIMLGDEPALETKVQVYHRLLGRLPGEAGELLEKEMTAQKSLPLFYDETVLPVIRMAETDVQQDKLDEAKAGDIFAALRDIADDLGEAARNGSSAVDTSRSPVVVCVPAGSAGDELSAHMLSHVLTHAGIRARALTLDESDGEAVTALQAERVGLIVICISPPSNLLRVRNLYKRLRKRFGEIPIVQGLWGGGDIRSLDGRIDPDGKAALVSSFVEAEKKILELTKK